MLIKVILVLVLIISSSCSITLVRPSKDNLIVKQKPFYNSKNLFKINQNDVYELKTCDKYGWCKIKDLGYVPKYKLSRLDINGNYIPFDEFEMNLKIKKEKTLNPKKKSLAKKKRCIKLKKVDLSSYNLLDKEDKDELLQKYNNQCINGKLIKEMITTISTYYQDNGYITTKAYLTPQNIKDGQIDIKILEGIIENIIHKETKEDSIRIKTAFIFQKNEPLNLRDLETSLESINRVPSSDASFKIQPSKKQGQSLVEIETKKTSPVHLSLGVSGVKTLEDHNPNLTAVLSLDNLLRINDTFTYRLNGTKIQKEYQSSKGSEYNYSFPIGSYIYDFTRSFTSYRQGVVGLNDTYLSNGDTTGTKVKISKVLNRDKSNKFEAAIEINHKSNENYFINELIEVSSYRTTQLQLKLNHTYIKNWGQIYSSYTYHQGTDWFSARDDNYNNEEVDVTRNDTLEFVKHTLDSNLTYYLSNRSYFFNSNLHLQHSDDYLYNTDKLTIGSAYTVRGYDKSNYYGNRGLYLKNDFTKNFSPNLNKYLLETVSIFIGLDYGNIKCQSDNKNACGELAGSAFGFKTASNTLSSDFTWSRALKKIDKNEETRSVFLYNLNIKF